MAEIMKNNDAIRYGVIGLLSALFVWIFWASRPEWDPEMRLWRAFGDAAYMLLILTLLAGPLARLWRPAVRALGWRRHTGVWFALISLVHTVLILHGWVRWDMGRFFGYEFVPQLGRTARLEPGFGMANVVGMVALFWALMLAATSMDRAVKALGGSPWKWLHSGAYTIFYLTAIHGAYFLYIHYTLSFHRLPAPQNWFRIPFLMLAGVVVLLQVMAFAKTVRNRKREPPAQGAPRASRKTKARRRSF